jgi:hypothetical protein
VVRMFRMGSILSRQLIVVIGKRLELQLAL